jgi:hypothetical protein
VKLLVTRKHSGGGISAGTGVGGTCGGISENSLGTSGVL